MERTVKERYKMPVAVWWLAMPLAVLAAYLVSVEGVLLALSPFHLKPVEGGRGSAFELYLSSFLGSLLAGFGWSHFAPMHRFAGAAWMAVLVGTPCFFCTNLFGGEGPPIEVEKLSLVWMIVGCVMPIVVYLILDRKELRNVRI